VRHIYLVSYGVKLDVEVHDDALLHAVEAILPPGWLPSDEFPEDGHFTLSGNGDTGYAVSVDGAPVGADLSPDVAMHVLDAQVRARIAVLAKERIFIHAGVVALDAYALLLPGPSFSGKSALVAALIDEGATYYSDEYAVLDRAGRAHPYPRRLSIRPEGEPYGDYTDVSSLRGRAGQGPARPALIAAVQYVPGSRWDPERQSPALGALALLTNAVPAQPRTEETMEALSRAADGTIVLKGDRGEAEETAPLLLASLEEAARSIVDS
jgi:hypothetical protein